MKTWKSVYPGSTDDGTFAVCRYQCPRANVAERRGTRHGVRLIAFDCAVALE